MQVEDLQVQKLIHMFLCCFSRTKEQKQCNAKNTKTYRPAVMRKRFALWVQLSFTQP